MRTAHSEQQTILAPNARNSVLPALALHRCQLFHRRGDAINSALYFNMKWKFMAGCVFFFSIQITAYLESQTIKCGVCARELASMHIICDMRVFDQNWFNLHFVWIWKEINRLIYIYKRITNVLVPLDGPNTILYIRIISNALLTIENNRTEYLSWIYRLSVCASIRVVWFGVFGFRCRKLSKLIWRGRVWFLSGTRSLLVVTFHSTDFYPYNMKHTSIWMTCVCMRLVIVYADAGAQAVFTDISWVANKFQLRIDSLNLYSKRTFSRRVEQASDDGDSALEKQIHCAILWDRLEYVWLIIK